MLRGSIHPNTEEFEHGGDRRRTDRSAAAERARDRSSLRCRGGADDRALRWRPGRRHEGNREPARAERLLHGLSVGLAEEETRRVHRGLRPGGHELPDAALRRDRERHASRRPRWVRLLRHDRARRLPGTRPDRRREARLEVDGARRLDGADRRVGPPRGRQGSRRQAWRCLPRLSGGGRIAQAGRERGADPRRAGDHDAPAGCERGRPGHGSAR